MSEYVSQCGCKIHVAQWTSKRKLVSIKYCQKHSGETPAQPSASEGERVEQVIGTAKVLIAGFGGPHVIAYHTNYYGQLVDNRFPEGATVEIIARLVPTKGGADHE